MPDSLNKATIVTHWVFCEFINNLNLGKEVNQMGFSVHRENGCGRFLEWYEMKNSGNQPEFIHQSKNEQS